MNGNSPLVPINVNPLDRYAIYLLVTILGTIYFIGFMYFISPEGRLDSLLKVGEKSTVRPYIEMEIGPVLTFDRTGHDGQIFYIIARDPLGIGVGGEFLPDSYRYRRILYPLLSGAGGYFTGMQTLYAMIFFNALGSALCLSAALFLTFQYRWSILAIVPVFACPGLILGSWLLTADPLAAGLCMTGLVLILRKKIALSALCLMLSVMTKEYYVAMSIAVSLMYGYQNRSLNGALLIGLPSALIYFALTAYWNWRFASNLPEHNLSLIPYQGLIDAFADWERVDSFNQSLTIIFLTCSLLALAILPSRQLSVIRIVLAVSLYLSSIAGHAVWVLGNNIHRAFPLLWILTFFLYFDFFKVKLKSPRN